MRPSDLRLDSTGHCREQAAQTSSLSLFTWEDKTLPAWVLFFQPLVATKDDFSKAWLRKMNVLPIPTLLATEVLLALQEHGPEVLSWSTEVLAAEPAPVFLPQL